MVITPRRRWIPDPCDGYPSSCSLAGGTPGVGGVRGAAGGMTAVGGSQSRAFRPSSIEDVCVCLLCIPSLLLFRATDTDRQTDLPLQSNDNEKRSTYRYE